VIIAVNTDIPKDGVNKFVVGINSLKLIKLF